MATDWLVDGWQQRTQQKLAFAGCMAALLSLRNDPLRTLSIFRDFTHKLMGYGGAAIIFSGIQETCRAVRGQHDFLNSAMSGAVTGALVVGHYQGPKYRFLGVVTWGSLGAVLHIANAVLHPRYYFEEYLIREGLLSPEATRYRQAAPSQPHSSDTGLLFPEYEHRDVLLAAKAIRDREISEVNQRLVAARTASTARPGGGVEAVEAGRSGEQQEEEEEEPADNDPGYQMWLRTSGFQADALLLQPQQQLHKEQPGNSSISTAIITATTTATTTSTPEHSRVSGSDQEAANCDLKPGGRGGGSEKGATSTATVANVSNWNIWAKLWKWRPGKAPSGGAGNADGQESNN
ncbi:hypothetical protein VaNZ11_002422 [Volvox africanus]|uniref:Uncharacterized protein n=1 Tax=Volvox africanus TaxID=51714 RepID=A0ABQ5RT83_9CHLO|nr:hypothetical protein VaNZ11_002422 [Volvox africanus]